MWDKFNTSWKLALITIGLVLIVIGLWKMTRHSPAPVSNPISTTSATEGPSIPHGSDSLPQPDTHTTGKITIHVKPHKVIETRPNGTKDTATVPEQTVVVYTRDDGPPAVHADSNVEVVYQKVRDPYVTFKLDVLVGVSANPQFQLSPAAFISGVQVVGIVRGGVGFDRFGVGPGIAVELLPNLSLSGRWNPITIDPGGVWAGAVLYRF